MIFAFFAKQKVYQCALRFIISIMCVRTHIDLCHLDRKKGGKITQDKTMKKMPKVNLNHSSL